MTIYTCAECGNSSQSTRFFSFTALIGSGVFGYLAGTLAKSYGLSSELTSAIAGFLGFMGAELLNLVVLLLKSRYTGRMRKG